MLTSSNVWKPEQPLKLYPTVIVSTVSAGETVKLMGVPCDVVPLHWPTLRDWPPLRGAMTARGPMRVLQPATEIHAIVAKYHAALVGREAETARVALSVVDMCGTPIR